MVSNPAAASEQVQVAISGDASEFNGAVDGAVGSLTRLNKKSLAVAAGGIAALTGALGAKGVSAAADFESSMADVAKVTDEQTADELADDIQAMSEEINLSSGELAQLTAQAGRFGVEGTENIKEFTRVAGEMGAATTLSADEAGRSLAKVAEATGTPLENVQQLGDAINELSNNMATNSAEITDSAQRAGFALQSMGMTSEEILGLSAAMNEVAPTSRRAAGMMRRMSEAIEDPDNVEVFAELLDVSTEEFERMREEEPDELMLDIAEAMEDNEDAASDLSQELSTSQARAFNRVAGRSEEMAEAMDLSNQAMEEGGSLSREVAIETDTLSGQMALLKSEINNVFIEIGDFLLPAVKDLVAGFSNAIDVGERLAANALPKLEAQVAGASMTTDGFANDIVPTAKRALVDLGSAAKRMAAGDWSSAFDALESSADNATDAVKAALVGSSGSGGLTGTVSTAVTNAQTYLQTEGETVIVDGFATFGAAAADSADDMTDILIGPDGESGVFSMMVDQGTRYISETAPTLIGDAFQAIGSGIRAALIDMTNPLRGKDSEIWDMIADAATWLITNIPKLMIGVGQGIVKAIIEGVSGLFKGLVGNSVLKDQIEQAGTWLINNMPTVLGDVGGAITSTIVGGVTGLKSALQSKISGAVDNAIEGAMDNDGTDPANPYGQTPDDRSHENSQYYGSDPDDVGSGSFTGQERLIGAGDNVDIGSTFRNPSTGEREELNGAATGGLVERTGALVAHEGERVVPASQVSDRGEVTVDMDAVVDELRAVRRTMEREFDISVEIRDTDRYQTVRR